jgi:hypothetical protein
VPLPLPQSVTLPLQPAATASATATFDTKPGQLKVTAQISRGDLWKKCPKIDQNISKIEQKWI